MDNYYQKYLKYKSKYIKAKQILEAGAHLPHAEVIPAPETSTYPIATEVPMSFVTADRLFRADLKSYAKSRRDKFVKYVDFLRSIHKKEIFDGYHEVFTRNRMLQIEGTDHHPPLGVSFGNDPGIYSDKYLLIFFLLKDKGLDEANFIQAKREYEEIKKREYEEIKRNSTRTSRESAGASKESAGASKESAAAAAPPSRYTATTPFAARADLIRYAKSRRNLFNKFVKAMSDSAWTLERSLTKKFYFTDDRIVSSLDRRSNPFGNDPNIYTYYILKIFKEFSIEFQENEEMFTDNFSGNFYKLAKKLFGAIVK